MTDPQTLSSLPDFLAAGDVAVVPRPRGRVPIKGAQLHGAQRPCVCSRAPARQDSSPRKRAAGCCDTGTALGEGILELLRDAELRRRLG